jgi:hypothetical protein
MKSQLWMLPLAFAAIVAGGCVSQASDEVVGPDPGMILPRVEPAAARALPKPRTKEETIAAFLTECDKSVVVALATVEWHGGKLSFTYVEVWKATGARPNVGETIDFVFPRKPSTSSVPGAMEILFLPQYPPRPSSSWSGWGSREGKVEGVQIADLKNALVTKRAQSVN